MSVHSYKSRWTKKVPCSRITLWHFFHQVAALLILSYWKLSVRMAADYLRGMVFDPWHLVPGAAAAATAYLVVNSIYLLYFHPASKFPGPRFAAISYIPYSYHWCVLSSHFLLFSFQV
jgi:hypothetical protein